MSEATEVCKTVFSSSAQKCRVVVDEMKILPSLRFRAGHVIGYSDDSPQKVARSILAIMIKPLFSEIPSFVMRLIRYTCIFPHNTTDQGKFTESTRNCQKLRRFSYIFDD